METARYVYQHSFEELLSCGYLLHNLLLLFISEPNKRDLTETKNEHAPTSVSQKPKLSKAERRAIQEAQRAAKAAAKEAGS
jgi:hypothetical protein